MPEVHDESSRRDPVLPELARKSPELAVATDMTRRAVVLTPGLFVFGALGWGWAGFWSVGLAVGLVLVNLLAGAAIIKWSADVSTTLLLGAVLGGYLARLGLISAVVLPLRGFGWFQVWPFAAALVSTHLGLLIWETRHVATSLAFSGVEPGHEFRMPFGPSMGRSA